MPAARHAPGVASGAFGARLALQQRLDRVLRGEPFVQHAVDRVADRHVDAVVPRQRVDRGGGGHAFGDVAELREDRGERLALRERRARRGGCATGRRCRSAPGRPVPRAPSASRAAPPSAADRRPVSASPRVISAARALWPKREPVARAGGDRQHVLHRAADLDAGDVVALVGAQRVAAQQRRHLRRRAPAPSPPPPPPSAGRGRPPRRSSGPRRRPRAPASAARAPGARARRPPGTPASTGTARNPLHSQTSGARAPARGQLARRPRAARRPASRRSATRHRPRPRARSSPSSAAGSAMPGRYLSLTRACPIGVRLRGVARPQRHRGDPPRRARWAATAVPQAPAPSTAADAVIRARRPRGRARARRPA